MTNREQVAWAFGFNDYDSRDLAEIVSDVMDAIGSCMLRADRERLAQWLELECDPETNNWGTFPGGGDDDEG